MGNYNESYHVHNTACPKCQEKGKDKAGNNLGVYSDSHIYCWACGYSRSGRINLNGSISDSNRHTAPSKSVKLPVDCEPEYPQVALDWAGQYNLTQDDLLRNGFMWSWEGSGINIKGSYVAADNLLVFPVFENDVLIAWQGRYFGHNGLIPKYVGRGKTADSLCIIKSRSRIDDRLVLVEDVMSAVKVAKAGWDCIPLFGTKVKSRIERIRNLKRFKTILWLDPDMHSLSVKYARLGTLEGLQMHSVLSTKDPKEHSVSEIQNYMR